MDFKKNDILEHSAIVLSLLFAVVISLYHISYNRFEGLSSRQWNVVWAIAENSFSLLMSGLIAILAGSGILRMTFGWIFIPYFVVKLIYHYSALSQIYIISNKWWEDIWSFICAILLMFGVGYCLKLMIKKRKYVAKIFKV